MGYYTYYDISVKDIEGNPVSAESTKIMAATLNNINFNEFELSYLDGITLVDMIGNDERKWYDCEEDMIKLSKVFSDKQFIITGQGEDRHDIWRMKVINGKSIWSQGEIWFPKLNEEL